VCGSPPHAWGILSRIDSLLRGKRFTPTRVGNSLKSNSTIKSDPVHPHTRGEFDVSEHCERRIRGSPPHAWGILGLKGANHRHIRFTPTRVGNSHVFVGDTVKIPVHPHTRGEFGFECFLYQLCSGSPPHAWGIRSPAGEPAEQS